MAPRIGEAFLKLMKYYVKRIERGDDKHQTQLWFNKKLEKLLRATYPHLK